MTQPSRAEKLVLKPNRVMERIRAGKYVLCGSPMQFDHPRMQETRTLIAATAQKYGKFWGMPVGSAAQAARLFEEEGGQFFACGAAIIILRDGYQAIRDEFDRVLGERYV